MKSLVLILVLFKVILSLAQIDKQNNGRWLQWEAPHQNDQVCHNRGLPTNEWPKVGVPNQMILPPPSPNNVGWRPNQGLFNWINPFYFGYSNDYTPWGYQQNRMFPARYPSRISFPSNLGVPMPFPIQPHLGPIHRPWSSQPHLGPTQGQWPMQQYFGPTQPQLGPRGQWPMPFFGLPNGPWPIPPHAGPQIPPYYIGERNNFYDN